MPDRGATGLVSSHVNGTTTDGPRADAAGQPRVAAQVALGAWAALALAAPLPLALAAALGLALMSRQRSVRPLPVLLGAAATAAARLMLPVSDAAFPANGFTSSLGGLAALLLGGGLLVRLGGSTRSAARTPTVVAAALFLGSLAIGTQLEALLRIGSRVGLGTSEDRHVFLAVLAVLILVGALCFGPLVRTRDVARAPWYVAGAGLLGLLALAVVGGVTSPTGLAALCDRFGADRSLAGTLRVDAAVAATVFVAPALALGAAAVCCGTARGLACVLGGVALGPLAVDRVLAAGPDTIEALSASAGSAACVKGGALVALAALAIAGRGDRIATGVAAALTLAAALVPISAVPVKRPWDRFAVEPSAIFETVQGQFILEERRTGARQAWLDQRALTPGDDTRALDAACLRRSIETARAGGFEFEEGPRGVVAIVGLLTPARTRALRGAGVREVMRCTGFPHLAKRLEEWLMADEEPLPGGHVGLHKRHQFGLVIHPPVGAVEAAGGASLAWGVSSDERSSHVVHWWPVDRPPMVDALESPLVATHGLQSFAVGTGQRPERRGSSPSAWSWLQVRPGERRREAQRLALSRWAAPLPPFHAALAAHAAAQRASSPFETPLERIELTEETLGLLRSAAVKKSPDALTRQLVEGAAAALEAQRDVQRAAWFLGPIVESHAAFGERWDALEVAMAWVEVEELRFGDAARRLDRLPIEGVDLADAHARARVYLSADRSAQAAGILERIHEQIPEARDVAADLAEAWVMLGDVRGRELAVKLLRDDPRNGRLMALARGLRSLTPEAALERATPGDR